MSRWGVALTTHPQLVPRLKKGVQLHLYVACSTVKFTEQDATFRSTVVLSYFVVFRFLF